MSSSAGPSDSDIVVNERTALLDAGQQDHKKATPLPKLQIGILLLALLVEPIASQSIYPYINQVSIVLHVKITLFNVTYSLSVSWTSLAAMSGKLVGDKLLIHVRSIDILFFDHIGYYAGLIVSSACRSISALQLYQIHDRSLSFSPPRH